MTTSPQNTEGQEKTEKEEGSVLSILSSLETVETIPTQVRGISKELAEFADKLARDHTTNRVKVGDEAKKEVGILRRYLSNKDVRLRTRIVDGYLYFWVPKPKAEATTA